MAHVLENDTRDLLSLATANVSQANVLQDATLTAGTLQKIKGAVLEELIIATVEGLKNTWTYLKTHRLEAARVISLRIIVDDVPSSQVYYLANTVLPGILGLTKNLVSFSLSNAHDLLPPTSSLLSLRFLQVLDLRRIDGSQVATLAQGVSGKSGIRWSNVSLIVHRIQRLTQTSDIFTLLNNLPRLLTFKLVGATFNGAGAPASPYQHVQSFTLESCHNVVMSEFVTGFPALTSLRLLDCTPASGYVVSTTALPKTLLSVTGDCTSLLLWPLPRVNSLDLTKLIANGLPTEEADTPENALAVMTKTVPRVLTINVSGTALTQQNLLDIFHTLAPRLQVLLLAQLSDTSYSSLLTHLKGLESETAPTLVLYFGLVVHNGILPDAGNGVAIGEQLLRLFPPSHFVAVTAQDGPNHYWHVVGPKGATQTLQAITAEQNEEVLRRLTSPDFDASTSDDDLLGTSD